MCAHQRGPGCVPGTGGALGGGAWRERGGGRAEKTPQGSHEDHRFWLTFLLRMISQGLLAFAKSKAHEYDLKNEETKSSLRNKVQDNQAKTLELVLAAVKSGSTIQQARVGAWR